MTQNSKEIVTIEELELASASQNYEFILKKLITLLTIFEQDGGLLETNNQSQCFSKEILQGYTRIAAVISKMIMDPAFELSQDIVLFFAFYHRTIQAIFSASGFIDTENLIKILTTQLQDNINHDKKNKPHQCILKILCLYSLDCELTFDFSTFFQDMPQQAMLIYLALLSSQNTIKNCAYQKKEQLLSIVEQLHPLELFGNAVFLASTAWGHCSYASHAHKHQVKKEINYLFEKWLAQKKISLLNIRTHQPEKSRPTLLVVLEQFNSQHAMYRCYAPPIIELAKKFRLIALTSKNILDNPAKKLFEEIIEVDDDYEKIEHIVNAVTPYQPDMVYYPSIGLATWSIILCNIKLAPIQVMTGGHPSSSFSKAMDYFVLEEGLLHPKAADHFSEKLIVLPNYTLPITAPLDHKTYTVQDREKPTSIRIAIAARSYKLSAPFIKTLLTVEQQSNVPVEFHFFPNEQGLRYANTKATLLRIMPNCHVHPVTNYETYCQNLGQCHLFASTYPFAGANSIFDALNLGVPIVTMVASAEIHSLSDAFIMKLCDLPAWLFTKSEAEYIQTLLRLIHDNIERNTLSKLCVNAVKEKYLNVTGQNNIYRFVEMMTALLAQHENLKKIPGPIFYEDLMKQRCATSP
jgi:hypothetical protein